MFFEIASIDIAKADCCFRDRLREIHFIYEDSLHKNFMRKMLPATGHNPVDKDYI